MLQKQLVHKVNKMVLENLTDDSEKSNPMGMEAPYSDWQVVNDDLVNYQDKDARGLTFVFSVVRMADNDAMKKYVSVYQKPDDDGSGAYVVVSMSPNNPNDVRVYEISNTAYGNEPEDPKLFMQKVIEMADGSGMLRSDDYGNYGIIETAEDFQGTPIMDGKGGSSNRIRGTYKSQANRGSQSTVKGIPVVGNQNNSNLKTYGNNNTPGRQSSINKNLSSAGFTAPNVGGGLVNSVKNAGQQAANRIGSIFKQHEPNSQTAEITKKSASPITNNIIANSKGNEKTLAKYDEIHKAVVNDISSNKKPAVFEQPVKNGAKSTTEQLGSKNSDEYPTPYKQRNVKGRTALGALKYAGLGLAGGLGNALLNSANGQQANLATVAKATVAGAAGGYYLGKKNSEKENANAKKQATSEDVAKINAMTSVYNKKKNVNIHDKEAYNEKMGRFDESNPDIRKAKIKARASTEGTRVKKGKYKKQEVEIGLDNRNISDVKPAKTKHKNKKN